MLVLETKSCEFESRPRYQMKVVMYKINEKEFENLDEALKAAKLMKEFVTIIGNNMEICGMFGVDEVKNGLTPDGHEYSWVKRRALLTQR